MNRTIVKVLCCVVALPLWAELSSAAVRTAPDPSSPKVYLTSTPARSGYDVPEFWRSKKIQGRDFWFYITHNPRLCGLWKQAGLENEPFIKESIMCFAVPRAEAFEYVFFDPASKVRQVLTSTDRPFCVHGQDGWANIGVPPSVCRRFLAEYGHRLVGFTATECFGNQCKERNWEKQGLRLPEDRREAFLGFVNSYMGRWATFGDTRLRCGFRCWALYCMEFRPWAICGTATYLDHYILEMGARMSGEEIGGLEVCTPMQFAFSRGAARQYGKPWSTYLAVWQHGGVRGGGTVTAYNVLSPECRTYHPPPKSRSWGGYDEGPWSGTSLSLQRRELLSAYMSGVNMLRDECDGWRGSLYVANYDYRDIHTIDPLVKVLREKPYCLSPAGALRKELYDIVKKHDRGTTYTPVALVFDRYHGFIPEYSRDHVLGVIPYTDADYMMRAVNNTLFPWEERKPRWRGIQVTGPFGDIFDVLTNLTSLEVLATYRAALLVGNVDIDNRFAGKLIEYVKGGGTLLINAKQVNDRLPEKFLGCKVTDRREEGKAGFSLLDGSTIAESKPFGFQYLQPTTASCLVYLSEPLKKDVPLVLANDYGKGRVIVTAPDYLYERGSKNRMLKLFSHLMQHLSGELLPVDVQGNVETIVNRNKNGWVITLINNEGVYRNISGKEADIKPEERVEAAVTLLPGAGGRAVTNVFEWTKEQRLAFRKTERGAIVNVTVPPGDVRIVAFELAK